MPNIRIFETDNTGASATSDFAVVFVPGTTPVLNNELLDSNGCVYIPSTTESLATYFENYTVSYTEDSQMTDVHLIQFLLDCRYGVVYKPINLNGEAEVEVEPVYIEVENVTADNFANNTYYTLSGGDYEEASSFSSSETYYVQVGKISSGWPEMVLGENYWSFLNDKNDYDIKFITTGNLGTIPVTLGTLQGTQKYAFDFSLANRLLEIATNRKDCALLADLNYNQVLTELGGDGNALAGDYKTALQYTVDSDDTGNVQPVNPAEVENYLLTKEKQLSLTTYDGVSSRAASLIPNTTIVYTARSGITWDITVPASIAYLYQYAQAGLQNATWSPISGVNRGVVGNIFTPDLSISKYYMDNDVITDGAGVSFNAIVNVRPYGYTIWGDRTLIEQNAIRGVQATSYLSLRNVISDVAKIAYESAIRYTYETNNDVTWMNFKTNIVTLLDQMVASGVLQTYKIGRKAPADNERNRMICILTLFPVLPVENFDVWINLENAEITITNDVTA